MTTRRRIEAGGRRAVLGKQDYKTLVERFEAPFKASDASEASLVIDKPCICNFYQDCHECPLDTWAGALDIGEKFQGCDSLLRLLGLYPKALRLANLKLWCSRARLSEAEQEKKAILEYLLSLPSVGALAQEG